MAKSDITRHEKTVTALTVPQELALAVLLAGATDAQAAEQANVTRQTVNIWRHNDAAFMAELGRRRAALWDEHLDRLRALTVRAIDIVAEALESDDLALRLRAATQVLKLADFRGLRPTGPITEQQAETDLLLRSF